MTIIGLTGYMQVGKSTVGEILARNFGFETVAFAAPLKKMVLALDPWVAVPMCSTHPEDDENVTFRHLSSIVEKDGWEEAKRYPDVRRLLQRMGTEAGRGILGPHVWIDFLRDNSLRSYDGKYAITDVRFQNEASYVYSWNGRIWRIWRDGYGPSDHPSEREIGLIQANEEICNYGTLEDLEEYVCWLYEKEMADA